VSVNQESAAADAPPSAVRVALALQVALAVTLLLLVAVAVAEAIHFDSLIDRAARTVGADPVEVALERSGNVSGVLFTGIPALLLAAWLGVTAWGMRRRSNVARILALVGLGAPLVMGVLACLAGGLLGVLLAGVFLQSSGEVDTADMEDADWGGEALFDELDRLSGSGWSIAFDAISGSGLLLVVLLAVATGTLLLTGTSRHYFQPRPKVAAHPYLGYGSGLVGPYPAPVTPAPDLPAASPAASDPENPEHPFPQHPA
jgi:hypothetical protein